MNVMANRWCRLYRGTVAENCIEPAIAALGYPYRTQFPLFLCEGGLRYFVDFLIPALKLVVEVDDPSHDAKAEEDAQRTADLARVHGWRVVRCTNEEAINAPVRTVERLTGLTLLRPPVALPLGLPRYGSKGRKSKGKAKTDRLPDRIPDREPTKRKAK